MPQSSRLLLCALLCGACHSGPLPPPKTPVVIRPSAREPKGALGLLSGAQIQRGLFDVYHKDGQVYLAVPRAALGRPFLLATHLTRGTGTDNLYAGKNLRLRICELLRRGDTIYLLQRSSYLAPEAGSGWEQSVEQGFAPTALESAKIEAHRADGAALIPVNAWMTSDLTGLAALVQRDLGQERAVRGPEKPRSFVESVQAFPENVNFSTLLTFSATEPAHISGLPDHDPRYLSVGVRYTLARLPQEPMTPRLYDERLGHKRVERLIPGRAPDPVVSYLLRWRLAPGQPLTFYLDPSIPAAYRPYVIAGVEAWDRALSAVGLRVQARPLPRGAAPGDLRYPTLRWASAVDERRVGVTSYLVDPRSGELLGASIVLSGTELVDNRLVRLLLSLQGRLPPGGALPIAYTGQFIKKTTMHEVGHALGLDHNFAASLGTPVERLGDAAWLRAHGVASSVMDYPAVNLPPRLSAPLPPDFPLVNQDLGPADLWAARYAYDPDEGRARALARATAAQGLRYAAHDQHHDEDDPDPTVGRHDLGDDPLRWARGRMALLREVLAALPGPLPGDDRRPAELSRMVHTVLKHYQHAAQIAARYPGGYQHFPDRPGDAAERARVVPVPKARQREALALIEAAVFRDLALPPALSAYEPAPGAVLEVQRALLGALLAPRLLSRLRDAELRFGAEATLGAGEVYEALERWLFNNEGRAPLALRELQRAYLERLSTFVVDAPRDLPGEARALAREHLSRLQRQQLAKPSADPATQAHRRDLLARVARALDGGAPIPYRF